MDIKQYTIDLHGKPYVTVAGRILLFWEAAKTGGAITTEVSQEGTVITVKATATVGAKSATGHASETVGGTGVNRTNALENAETSAIGRALGTLGFGLLSAGGVASADEVQNAMSKGTEVDSVNAELAGEVITEETLTTAGLVAKYACQDCLAPITEAEHSYSTKLYKRPLCRTHQAAEKSRKSPSTAAR